jgi:predicted metal-dependent phosphoesterase TrpH
MESTTRADLHVHSKYSDRPAEWFLRRVGAPECFVEPSEVYQRAREAGMDFVTIADHNTINGALEIAHLADAFISVEVTTYFPEDGCKVHCLVAGIDERQFQMIQELRASIYELREYVEAEGIFCAVNHPLYRVNGRLTVAHLEKLLVMFNRFEAINGSRDLRSAAVLRAVLASLTPELLGGLAECHRLEPCGPEPWVKRATGGSDDHSGAHIGSAYTVAPAARSAAEYLAHLHAGRHAAGGAAGGSLLLAQSLYHIAASYYRQRFLRSPGGRPSLLGELLDPKQARPTEVGNWFSAAEAGR